MTRCPENNILSFPGGDVPMPASMEPVPGMRSADATELDRVASALRARYAEERDTMLADFDQVGALLNAALSAHRRGDQAAAHKACRELLDAEHALLGDCYSEPLTTLLGYDDEEDES